MNTMRLFILLVLTLVSCQQRKIKANSKTIEPPSYILENKGEIQLFVEEHDITNTKQIIKKEEHLELTDTIIIYKSYVFETFSLSNYTIEDNQIGSDQVRIVNGYPIDTFRVMYGNIVLKSIPYKDTNYSGVLMVHNLEGTLLYQNRFKEGSGYWKDYYHKEAVLKEEGEVRKNYKYGKWTYYSKTGEIDSTKHYTFQDSVDVRYPYCFFNKTEPCY